MAAVAADRRLPITEKREARSEKREARSEKRETRSEKREARSEKRETRSEKREARNDRRLRIPGSGSQLSDVRPMRGYRSCGIVPGRRYANMCET
ncbi:hypothetical protein DM56_4018 [Burkholderia mallei]|nr:hypothetical protein DM56_4018 [Burkholderia mallei]